MECLAEPVDRQGGFSEPRDGQACLRPNQPLRDVRRDRFDPDGNQGKDFSRLFKTGDAVDIQLGTNPNAPAAAAPQAGDLDRDCNSTASRLPS